MTRSPAPGAASPGGLAAEPGPRQAEEELADVREQLREAREIIQAIRDGGIDSLVVGPAGQEQVYGLPSADRTYRLIVESMNEGAAAISPRGIILEVNPRLASMTGRPASELIGTQVLDLVPGTYRAAFARLLGTGAGGTGGAGARGDLELAGPRGTTVPVLLAASSFDLDSMRLRCLIFTDLTGRRTAEPEVADVHETLREQGAFLEQARASVGLGWWIVDPRPTGRITTSAETARIFGLAPENFDGMTVTFWGLVHPDDRPRISAVVEAALRDGAPISIEHRIAGLGAAERWVLQSAVVERDEAGAPSRLLGICQDVTDRKRIEDEMRAGAAYNRSLIEAGLDPLVTIGPEGAITDINTAAERMTGRSRAELLGTEFSDYFTEPERARAGYQQVFRDGSVRDYALELRHRDGHSTPVLYNASVYRDPSGRVLGAVAVARDVTQVNRAQAALRHSEARLRSLFDNVPVGMADMSPDGEIVQVNSRYCQITGYDVQDLQWLQARDLIHPDDVDADMASMERLRSGELNTYSMEKRYLRKGGGIVWAEVNRTVVRDSDGVPAHFVTALRDITAQRQAEAEAGALRVGLESRVRQRTAELERANANLESFTYTVSHDLRAPLRALTGFSETLLEEYGDRLEETGRGYAERIQVASERMDALIRDLLRLSRESRAEISPGPVDLSAEIAAIADELQAREPARRVRFLVQGGVWVTADRGLIRTVVQNLIENAWKFTARRDAATIEFGAAGTSDRGEVCCYVRDNGAGFDPAFADQLFQPFRRLHAASDFPGTGIGLASVRQIVERHGGRVWAEGAPGDGSTFFLTLAAAVPADAVRR